MNQLVPNFILQQFASGRQAGQIHAAALSVDMVGFTPMTETLTRDHRDGAEAVTKVLNTIFEENVREVHRRGGIIPLFAGDAFTAVFPAGESEAAQAQTANQALQAAFAIRDFFSAQQAPLAVKTAQGDFQIGVRIGLSFGQVSWGIPGGANRVSFYFQGPAMERAVAAQGQAATQQILADGHLLALTYQQVTAVPQATSGLHRLKQLMHTEPPPPLPPPVLSKEQFRPFVPDAILDDDIQAEFREVCPIFISFESMPETAVFHQMTETVQQLLKEYGGYLNQIEFGDKGGIYLILFGAPVAYENNVERAAAFLLALKDKNMPVSWRAGMTFGILWAGIRGSLERSEYGVVGDMINLAARLATKSDWGQIWVSESVNRQLEENYWLGPLGEFSVKGKAQSVPVYRLFKEKEMSEEKFFSDIFVGRKAELEQVATAVQPAFNRHFAGLTIVHGDAGVGKSRLVYEFRRQVIGQYFPMTIFCPAAEILRTSLNPFKSFLRAYFRQGQGRSQEAKVEAFDAVFDFLLQQLPGTHPESKVIEAELKRTRSILAAMVDLYTEGSLYDQLDPELRFENMLAAFKNFVKAASLSRPVIIHIDNGQWLDPDSLRMITWISRNMADYAVAIVCVCRYLDDGSKLSIEVDADVPQQSIELSSLLPEEIQALAEKTLQAQVSEAVVTFLYEKAAGNPFFTEQLLMDLWERGGLKQNGGLLHLEAQVFADVPTNISTILLSRLDRLNSEIKRIVRTATVLGQEFEYSVLADMLKNVDDLRDKVNVAVEKQVWLPKTEYVYQFRSALLRDVAYTMQLRSQLRRLHILAAQAIENRYEDATIYAADLAYHYDRGDEMVKAIHWYEVAGMAATSRYANVEALHYFSRALELLPQDDARRQYDLLVLREPVYALLGDVTAQEQDLAAMQAISQALGDYGRQAQTALRRAAFAEASGDFDTTIEQARTAVRLALSVSDEHQETLAHLVWGRALVRLGQYTDAREQFEKALQRAINLGLAQEEADSYRNLGALLIDRSQYDEAKAVCTRALPIYRKLADRRGESTTLNNLGVINWRQGDYVAARHCYEEASGIYHQIGYRRGESIISLNLATFVMTYGDYRQANGYSQKTLDISKEIGERFGHCFALLNLGLNEYYRANYGMAATYSQEALALAQEMGALRLEGYGLMNLGHAAAGQCAWDEAAVYYERALIVWQSLQNESVALEAKACLAEVALAQQKSETAVGLVAELLPALQDESTLVGAENPLQIVLSCYNVLAAVGDAQAATVLRLGYHRLQQQAAAIQDEITRRAFLEKVETHRRLVQEFSQLITIA